MNYKAPDNSLHFLDDGRFAHLLPAGSLPITPGEAEALTPVSPPPTPLEQIRALEAQYADAQARVTRQSLLELALERAAADPAAQGLTKEQVHAFLMTRDNGYSALFNLEQQVAALRALV